MEVSKMGDLGYFVKCYDCGKEFMCGEHILTYPPIERVCYHCALKRLKYTIDESEPYNDDLEPCLPYYDSF
jgi:DNA-directed RNA polymerase subunit RPC12/RpoP